MNLAFEKFEINLDDIYVKDFIKKNKLNMNNTFLNKNTNDKKEYLKKLFFKRQYSDIDLIHENFINKSYPTTNCVKINQVNLSIGGDSSKSLFYNDCYSNSFLFSIKTNAKLVFGIGINSYGMAAIHMWNKVDSYYVDTTWEFLSNDMGEIHIIVRELEPHEYFTIWKSMTPENQDQWIYNLINFTDFPQNSLQLYKQYLKNLI